MTTNGFFGLKLALLLCDSVTVYGFVRSWRGHFPYHYFNDEIPNDTQFRRDSGGELPLIQRLVHHYGESRLRFRHPCVLNRKCPWDVCAYGSQCEKGGTPYPVPQKGYCVRHVGIMPGTPEEGQPVVPPLPNGKPTLYAAQAEHLRGLPSAVRSSPSSRDDGPLRIPGLESSDRRFRRVDGLYELDLSHNLISTLEECVCLHNITALRHLALRQAARAPAISRKTGKKANKQV